MSLGDDQSIVGHHFFIVRESYPLIQISSPAILKNEVSHLEGSQKAGNTLQWIK